MSLGGLEKASEGGCLYLNLEEKKLLAVPEYQHFVRWVTPRRFGYELMPKVPPNEGTGGHGNRLASGPVRPLSREMPLLQVIELLLSSSPPLLPYLEFH